MSITSANSVLVLGVVGLYTVPQQMTGFADGDAYSVDNVDVTESRMGVDGKMSTGWIPQIKVMHITLQADSPSNTFFEAWYAAQQNAREYYQGFGALTQASVGRVYALTNGVLCGYTPIGAAKKVLEPRSFTVKWEEMIGSPAIF